MYRYGLERFLADCSVPLSELKFDDVLNWLRIKFQLKKTTTMNNAITILSIFFKYCREEGYIERVLIKRFWRPRNPKSVPKFLSKQDLAQVRLAAEKFPLRERVILEFFISTGCRLSELYSLNVSDIDVKNRTALVMGKGRKLRYVHFSETCAIILCKYLLNLSLDNPALFPKPKGGRLSRKCIAIRITKLGRSASLSRRISPHCLRHTFATNLLSKGADLNLIMALLGHDDINTTRIYANLLPEQVIHMYRRYMG